MAPGPRVGPRPIHAGELPRRRRTLPADTAGGDSPCGLVVDRGATVNIVSEKNTDCNRDNYNPDAPWPPPEFPPPVGPPEFGQFELFKVVMNAGPGRVCGTLNCVEVNK